MWLELGGAALAGALLYYLTRVVQRPRVVHCPKALVHARLLREVPEARSLYWPTFWCAWTHLQTPLNVFARREPAERVEYARHMVRPLHDGGQMSVDEVRMRGVSPSTPTVVVLTGLTGGSQELEIRLLAAHFRRLGMRTFVVNFRGQQDTPLLTRIYGECSTDDLHRCTQHIVRQLDAEGNRAPLLAFGYSAGANVVATYAGQMGQAIEYDGVISVSNPFDLRACTEEKLKEVVQRNFYDVFFPPKRKAVVRQHSHLFEPHVDLAEMERASGTLEYDRAVTRHVSSSPSNDLHDMYHEHSSRNYLQGIRVPTLFLLALDDPFIAHHAIPSDADIASNCMLELISVRHGGHIAFFDGLNPLSGPTWSERLCGSWALSLVKLSVRDGVQRKRITGSQSDFQKWLKM